MIHKALRMLRQYHEMKPTDLSDKLGITKFYLLDIESGKKPVSADLLKMYSSTFDIPLTSLIFFSDSISNEGKIAKKFRVNMAGKILEVADWLAEKHEKKI